MIVAVTLDPVAHVSYDTKRIVPGTTHQVGRVRYRAGGRGLAVARMLHTFGHEVVAAGLVGGTAGEAIRAELARRGVPTQFTPIAMESRRVVEVTDASSGTTTSFAEPPPYITTEELGRLAGDYRGLVEGASAAVLCGGLPDGLPPETYGTFATYAAEAGVPVVLDAGGSALRHGAARGPALVIPEPQPAAGQAGAGQAGAAQAAVGQADDAGGVADPVRLVAGGVGAVVTMCGTTVHVLTAGGGWRAWLAESAQAGRAGGDQPGSGAVGSGGKLGGGAGGDRSARDWSNGAWPVAGGPPAMSRDALVAGFVPGIALGWSWPDSLTHAVSLAAAAGLAGDVDLVTYERLLPHVIVEPVAGQQPVIG